MRTTIEEYIKSCPSCQKNKTDNHAKYGYLQKMKLPEFPWMYVTMDFIVALPPSVEPSTGNIYDAIMVVVDRHTKYTTAMPFDSTYSADQMAYLFLDRVVRIRGFPKEIILNRDSLFTSKFWKTLAAKTSIKLKFSITYHLKTDKQTEKMNRTLKQYLRYYVNLNQNN